jgi:ferric-dicitrate binding protein FerR (iron transport regulator)
MLADGSRAVLAPGSRLTETDPAAGASRSVRLDGRAYFEVLPDPARPFRVEAGGTVTRVLGTKFDVRAYAGTSATEVVVRSGRVAVRPASLPEAGAHPLSPGERATLGADGSVVIESGVDVDALIGWTSGTLAFRGTPLRDVVPELEGWFDLEIRLADSALGGRRITATFDGEPRDVVLGAVAELVDARVDRDGRRVVFTPFRSR